MSGWQSQANPLQGKQIVLGVCGSIAAYKAADLASKLVQGGAKVDVILTDAAQEFIAPLTFRSLTGRPVFTSMYRPETDRPLETDGPERIDQEQAGQRQRRLPQRAAARRLTSEQHQGNDEADGTERRED